MALDPHGRWGPMLQNFLFNYKARVAQATWKTDQPHAKPNANAMFARISNPPCPSGIVLTAAAAWNANRSRKFYGHSHTAPTPKIHILQQLGLSITKGYALHLRNATRRMGVEPQIPGVATP